VAVPAGESRRAARERHRSRALDEIKDAALERLAAGGLGAVTLAGIARDLGVPGSTLRGYVASRDALLAALVRDAGADLVEAVAAATAGTALSGADRLRAWAHAYRRWALYQPHRYRLLQARPEQAALLADLGDARRGVVVLARVHGLVDLELAGVLDGTGLDPAEVFDAEVTALLG
jgi:AcrR family transcriptional regulator